MKLKETKIRCPRCRSPQKFHPNRKYGEGTDKFTVFIRCQKCHKEIDLYESNDEIEHVKKLLRKVQKEHSQRPTQSSLNLLSKFKKRLYNLERSLSEEQENS